MCDVRMTFGLKSPKTSSSPSTSSSYSEAEIEIGFVFFGQAKTLNRLFVASESDGWGTSCLKT